MMENDNKVDIIYFNIRDKPHHKSGLQGVPWAVPEYDNHAKPKRKCNRSENEAYYDENAI